MVLQVKNMLVIQKPSQQVWVFDQKSSLYRNRKRKKKDGWIDVTENFIKFYLRLLASVFTGLFQREFNLIPIEKVPVGKDFTYKVDNSLSLGKESFVESHNELPGYKNIFEAVLLQMLWMNSLICCCCLFRLEFIWWRFFEVRWIILAGDLKHLNWYSLMTPAA